MTDYKPVLSLLAIIASGLATACTVQTPTPRAATANAGALSTYSSQRYYEAPTSIAASIRRTAAATP